MEFRVRRDYARALEKGIRKKEKTPDVEQLRDGDERNGGKKLKERENGSAVSV